MLWIIAGFKTHSSQSDAEIIYFGHDADAGTRAVRDNAGKFVRFGKTPAPTWIPVAAPAPELVEAPVVPEPSKPVESEPKKKKP